MSDQVKISPYKMDKMSSRQVMNQEKYRLGDYLLIPYQILQSNIIITMADSEENH